MKEPEFKKLVMIELYLIGDAAESRSIEHHKIMNMSIMPITCKF